MKLKKIFVTLGLSLGVGMGVGAGLCAASSEAKETNAVTSTTVYCALNTDAIISAFSISDLKVVCNVNYKGNGDEWGAHNMSYIGDATTFTGKKVYSVTFDDKYDGLGCIQFQVLDGTSWKCQGQPFGTQSWTLPSIYNNKLCELSYNNSNTLSVSDWVDYTPTVSKWTITKKAVEFIDGVAQEPADWNLGSDEVYDGVSHSVPGTTYKNLDHFDGWYTDASCTTEYNGTASVTSNFTIYAKYTRLSVDSYVYWISESTSPVFDHFYAYNEYDVGTWPGESITDDDSYEVHGSMHFNGLEQKIYRIPVPSNADFVFILNNNNDKQTYDVDYIVAGGAYYTWLKDGESKYSWNYNADATSALDLLFDAESVRNAVKYEDGAPADYSVCGISPAEAARLYVLYEGLDDEALKMVNNTTTHTYNGTDTSKQIDVYYSAIMAELYDIALKNDDFAANHLSSRFSPIFVDADNSALIIAVTAFTAILATGGFFFLRRRKEN